MIVPPPTSLSRIALKRLQAIQELTDLGSGLKLAMRDLEIRGAGNLLGAEQSGFIEDVGFELYQKIVDEAVDELKHEEFRDLFREQLEAEERGGGAADERGYRDRDRRGCADPERAISAMTPSATISTCGMYAADDLAIARGRSSSEMRDRFGPVPAGDRCTSSSQSDSALPRCRPAPQDWSFRDGVMRLELPPESNQTYYDRWFQPIMQAIARQPFVQLETKGKLLAIVFAKVTSVEEAERALMGFRDGLLEGESLSGH